MQRESRTPEVPQPDLKPDLGDDQGPALDHS